MTVTETSEKASIGGVDIDTAGRDDLVRAMVSDCLAARGNGAPPKLVFDVNGHALSLRHTDGDYRQALDQADIIHADGGFLVAISHLRRGPTISERSATTDMIHDAAAVAARKGLRFALLGGEPGLADRAASRLRQLYPDLQIVSCEHGFFRPEEEDALLSRINAAEPDVIWVGLGKPIEQLFCIRNRDRLRAGWLITCGGCFNFITGDYRRAPLWMQNWGLEWLHRMVTGPRSLIMRYLITNPHALYLALTR